MEQQIIFDERRTIVIAFGDDPKKSLDICRAASLMAPSRVVLIGDPTSTGCDFFEATVVVDCFPKDTAVPNHQGNIVRLNSQW